MSAARRHGGAGSLRTALVLAGLMLAVEAGAAPVTHTIVIERMAFAPAALVVHPGDRVVWVNRDPFPHTATAAGRAFDSGSIAPDKSWSWRAGAPGEFDYVCALHTTMKGRVTVR